MAECACGCGRFVRRKFARGHNRRLTTPEYLIDSNGCWVWQRATNKGYGVAYRDGRVLSAHRLYFIEAGGSIPDGMDLDHLCRNRACVNPAHLEPVRRAENIRRGIKTKLTRGDANAIQKMLADGWRRLDIAHAFNVTPATIGDIKSGRTWRL